MRNIKEFLDAWFAAKPTKEARNDIAVDIWYDWFCTEKGLFARTRKFIGPLHQLIKALPEAGALIPSGQNCCPVSAPLYDRLRIFDGDTFVCGIAFGEGHYDFEHRFELENNDVYTYLGDDHKEMVAALIQTVRNYFAAKAAA